MKILSALLFAMSYEDVTPYSSSSSSPYVSSQWALKRRRVPEHRSETIDRPLIIGYAHNASSGKTERAIQDGADVIIWSFLHFDLVHELGRIKSDLNFKDIRKIRDEHEHVVHLAAFGGWNGPHPPVFTRDSQKSGPLKSLSGKSWFDVFMKFNKSHGYLFDGVDWDYEGHDDLNLPTAKLTLETLDIMADFSIAAKENGLIVTMAPAESYLDASAKPGIDSKFSLDLDFPPRAWTSLEYNASDEDRELVQSVGFSHAGRQCYAYVLAKAGIETFDWISIQFYEAYSPFAHDVSRMKLDHADALMKRVNRLINGYTVTNLPLPSSPEYIVKIPPSKLVLGVANSWADGLKFCKVSPSALRTAYDSTIAEYGHGYFGVMFWTIEEEEEDDKLRFTYSLNHALQKSDQQNNISTTKENKEL